MNDPYSCLGRIFIVLRTINIFFVGSHIIIMTDEYVVHNSLKCFTHVTIQSDRSMPKKFRFFPLGLNGFGLISCLSNHFVFFLQTVLNQTFCIILWTVAFVSKLCTKRISKLPDLRRLSKNLFCSNVNFQTYYIVTSRLFGTIQILLMGDFGIL